MTTTSPTVTQLVWDEILSQHGVSQIQLNQLKIYWVPREMIKPNLYNPNHN